MKTNRIVAAVALALWGASALYSSTAQSTPANDTDRVPNKDRFQDYPRWMRMAAAVTDDADPVGDVAFDMAVQDDGTVHLIRLGGTFEVSTILYANNRPETRTRTGFSAGVVLKSVNSNAEGKFLAAQDIAAAPNGAVTIVYAITGSPLGWTDLYARQYDPVSGSWSGETQLTTGSREVEVGVETRTKTYGNPSIRYDNIGNLHMAYTEEIFHSSHVSASLNTWERANLYSMNLGGGSSFSSGTISVTSGSGPLGISGPRGGEPSIGIDVDGNVSILFNYVIKSSGEVEARYARRSASSGSWSTTTLSQDRSFTTLGLAVDTKNNVHAVYGKWPKPEYRLYDALAGTWGPVEVLPTVATYAVEVGVDSRDKPVVMAASEIAEYLTKVKQDVADPNHWVVQSGLDALGGPENSSLCHKMFVTPNDDAIHSFHGGLYYRQIEPNLGVQDAFTMVPFGPATTANVATGNLRFELPLFGARGGYGFPASFGLVYNSKNGVRGSISPGWSTSFDAHIIDDQADSHHIWVHMGEGRLVNFESYGSFFLPWSEYGLFSRLERNVPAAGQYRLTSKNGIKHIFGTDGKLLRIEDTQSTPNKMEFAYTDGLLSSISDSQNRSVVLTYDAMKRLKTVKDPGNKTYTLSYKDSSNPQDPMGPLEFVKFDGAPTGTVQWKFDYWTKTDFQLEALPPKAEHKGLLSKIFTPRGGIEDYFWQFGYKPDGRVISCLEPEVESVEGEADLVGPLTTSAVKAERNITYIDPVEPFDVPNASVAPGATRQVPAALVKNRRGQTTRIEYQYMRCLADRIEDALPASQGGPGVIRRYFDGHDFTELQDILFNRFRNLKTFIDAEGNATEYAYTHEEGVKERPQYVKDNLRRISQPAANATDPTGGGGALATVDTAKYTYEEGTTDLASFSLVKSVEDAFGNTTNYKYDPAGNLEEIQHPGTNPDVYTYDGKGRVATHTAPENGVTIFGYGDASTGLPTSITRPGHSSPETFVYTLDTMGLTHIHSMPMGGTSTTSYDGLYRVTDQINPPSNVASSVGYTYDADSNVKTVTGPGTAYSETDYDHLGRAFESRRRGPGGAFLVTRFKYDKEGNLRETKDPNNHYATALFDELNRTKSSRSPGPPAVTTTILYNRNSQVTRQTVGTTVNDTVYTARGLVKKISNGGFAAQSSENTYFEDGALKTSFQAVSGAPATASAYGYDSRRRMTSTTQVTDFTTLAGSTTIYVLDGNGNRKQVIDPDGRSTYFEFDAADRQTIVRDHNLAFLSENVYDNDDRVFQTLVAHPSTGIPVVSVTRAFYSNGQVLSETDVLGQVTSFEYDGQGGLAKRTAPPSNGSLANSRTEYDEAGRVKREIHAEGTADQAIWVYEYDANGNRTRVTDPRLNQYVSVYDGSNRLIELQYPSVGGAPCVESWTFDDRGNVSTHTDPEGKVATMTYDLKNRKEAEVHVKGGLTIADLHWTYDQVDNVVSIEDRTSKIRVSFTTDGGLPAYDVQRHLTQVRWFLEAGTANETLFSSIKYQDAGGAAAYDLAGNLTGMRLVNGLGQEVEAYRYVYDFNGRLVDIYRQPGDSTSETRIARTIYSASGAKQEVQLAGGVRQTWSYDAKSRVTSIQSIRPDTSIATRIDYPEYDARDRRVRATYPLLNREVSYTYDFLDRLTGETWQDTSGGGGPPAPCPDNTQLLPLGNFSVFTGAICVIPAATGGSIVYQASWQYDGTGNRTRQLEGGIETIYAYDAQNRLNTETRGATTISYGYDLNGNQSSRTEGGLVELFQFDFMNRVSFYTKAGISTSYRYTPEGHRIAKVTGSAEEWYMSDGQDVAADYSRTGGSGSFTLQRTYVNGRSIDAKIARIDAGSGVVSYYAGDALNSVHAMLDTNGQIARQELSTAWGRDLPGSSSGPLADRYGFTQREDDPESGLMHYRARSYDPRVGRFLQFDPPVQHRTQTHFLYAGNQPTAIVDPTGMYEVDVHYYMTYYLARRSGFTGDQAYQIAGSTQFADDSPRTQPVRKGQIFGNKWDMAVLRTLHFAQDVTPAISARRQGAVVHDVVRNSATANGIFNRGLRGRDLVMAGVGLHLLEDSYSHEGYDIVGNQLGHALPSISGLSPDIPQRTRESGTKAIAMALRVNERLAELSSQVGAGGQRFGEAALREELTELFFRPPVYRSPGGRAGALDVEQNIDTRIGRWADRIRATFGDNFPRWNPETYRVLHGEAFDNVIDSLIQVPQQ